MKGRVGSEADRVLPTPEHPEWRPGGQATDFRASVVRNNHKWAVRVKCVSVDGERAFVKFESGEDHHGQVTAWVPVDDLQEG